MPKQKKTTKPAKPSAAKKKTKPSPAKASAKAGAVQAAGGTIGADGRPSAPLIILSENETKLRLKVIMGAQCGENPANIGDNSPIRRPNILLPRLVTAINRHFYPGLDGIIGFPAGETVIRCARRIKSTRDPQMP